MTTASHAAVTAEASDIDTSARCTLSLLIASALAWLLVSGLLAVLHLVQAYDASFLAHCPIFTYGRLGAMQETAAIYGWAANAGLAVALWLLGRLGGAPLRSLNWACGGALFWNLGVTAGVIGIALGEGSSTSFLHLPYAVQPLLVVAYAAIAVPGVLAWTGRKQSVTFAAQWYAVAALFLFPWLLSAAQVMLHAAPVRGVLQAIVEGWYVQSVWTLWLFPLALAAAYYLVPKITGRAIPSYDFSSLGFWTLLVIGGWTAGRHLVGGPVPAWLVSIAIVSCTMLLVHFIIVALNLRGAFGGGGPVLKFVAFGLFSYLVGGLWDAVTCMRNVAEITQFTWIDQAQTQLALTGAFSAIVIGAIYFLFPRVTGQAWPSATLIRAHLFTTVIGTLGLVLSLVVAGWIQGHDLANPAVSFADIAAHTSSWLHFALAAQVLLLVGNALFALHFLRLAFTKPAKSGSSVFVQPPAMEASVS